MKKKRSRLRKSSASRYLGAERGVEGRLEAGLPDQAGPHPTYQGPGGTVLAFVGTNACHDLVQIGLYSV